MSEINTKKAVSAVRAACQAAVETLCNHLSTMDVGSKTTQGELHTLIGSVRTEDGKEITDRFDVVKLALTAMMEANPDAFQVEPHGRNAGIYRGSKPVKADQTPEEKEAAKVAAKAARSEVKAKAQNYDALAKQLAELQAQLAAATGNT